jgi:hypothetical protein
MIRAGDSAADRQGYGSDLEAAAARGATGAGWVMLRLPREVAPLFRDWLRAHYPLRAEHVMSVMQQIRGGPRLRRHVRTANERQRCIFRADRKSDSTSPRSASVWLKIVGHSTLRSSGRQAAPARAHRSKHASGDGQLELF